MRKTAAVPVITKPAAVRQLSPEAQALFRLEAFREVTTIVRRQLKK